MAIHAVAGTGALSAKDRSLGVESRRPVGPPSPSVVSAPAFETAASIVAEGIIDEVRVLAADSLHDVLFAQAIAARLMAAGDVRESERDEGQ